ncbi:MAG: hypothetical protein NC200_07880 [Candidatus Gastranaerophilales bacterium]|nr:hypothetical protein [Candidatus Gastranaerophilales bacterium]
MAGNTLFNTLLIDKLVIRADKDKLSINPDSMVENWQEVMAEHFPSNAYEIKTSWNMVRLIFTPTRYGNNADGVTDTNLIMPLESELYRLFQELGFCDLSKNDLKAFNIGEIHLTMNILVDFSPYLYIKYLRNRSYKGSFEPIEEGSKHCTVILAPLTRNNEQKDITGAKKHLFYDKVLELFDKANLRNVFLRLPLTEKEINLLPENVYSPKTQGLWLDGLNILRHEIQLTGAGSIKYITRFLDEEAYKTDKHLTLLMLLKLLDNGILYDALEAYYKREMKQKIFYDKPESGEVKLNKYEQLLAELMRKESATHYLAMFKECDCKYKDSLSEVFKKIYSADDNSLYAEMYRKFDLRKL